MPSLLVCLTADFCSTAFSSRMSASPSAKIGPKYSTDAPIDCAMRAASISLRPFSLRSQSASLSAVPRATAPPGNDTPPESPVTQDVVLFIAGAATPGAWRTSLNDCTTLWPPTEVDCLALLLLLVDCAWP